MNSLESRNLGAAQARCRIEKVGIGTALELGIIGEALSGSCNDAVFDAIQLVALRDDLTANGCKEGRGNVAGRIRFVDNRVHVIGVACTRASAT